MPGNPLTKITKNLETAGWPYDPAAAANAKWSMIPTTPAPKAVFDASDPSATLSRNGRIVFNNAVAENQPNEVIPNFDGRRGFKFSYNAKPDPFGQNAGNEARFRLTTPDPHPWEVITLYQPTNYTVRQGFGLRVTSAATITNWLAGDQITTDGGHVGEIYGSGIDNSGNDALAVTNYTGHHSLNWDAGKTITNNRTGETLTSQGSALIGSNNKTSIWWVDDGGAGDGYSNGAYNMEVDAKNFDGHGWIKFQVSASNYAANIGTRPNQLPGDGDAKVFDKADNGSVITLITERERCPITDDETGVFRLWKITERPGGDYPTPALVYENTSLRGYTEPEDNVFTNGYLFGYANSGYKEQTDFYILRYEYWTEKPDILTEAGL